MPIRPTTGLVRLVVGGAAAAGGAVAAGFVTAGVRSRGLALRLRRSRSTQADTVVLAVDRERSRVRLQATDPAAAPGTYSFWFDGGVGHAVFGPVLARGVGWVERRFEGGEVGALEVGSRGRFNGWVMLSPAALGRPYRDERVQTTLGGAPAWYLAPESGGDRWVILVHGRGSVRQEALRAVPAVLDAGFHALVVSYRNDGEAPAFVDAAYQGRDLEWLDVESAVLHALDLGATRIVLMGWGTAARILLQTVRSSRLASVVVALVLDSPDLPATPERGRTLAADRSLRAGGHAAPALRIPVLVLHGEADDVAAEAPIAALSAANPRLVRVETVRGGRHAKLWNVDPDGWRATVTRWLGSLDELAADQADGAFEEDSANLE